MTGHVLLGLQQRRAGCACVIDDLDGFVCGWSMQESGTAGETPTPLHPP